MAKRLTNLRVRLHAISPSSFMTTSPTWQSYHRENCLPLDFARFFSSFLFSLNCAPHSFDLFPPISVYFCTRHWWFPIPRPSVTHVTSNGQKSRLTNSPCWGDPHNRLYYLFLLAISHNSEKQKYAGTICIAVFVSLYLE